MEAPVTNIEHLLIGRMYSLYEQVLDFDGPDDDDEDEKWSTLPTYTATYLGMGMILGDRVAVFQSDDPKADFGGLILIPEKDLNRFTYVLPLDPDDDEGGGAT
jgi:hypothetical protein